MRENSHGSVALNVSNTIKMFNTTNRTSRFPTRDYSDIIGIHLRKFTRIIQKQYQNFVLSKVILFDVFNKYLIDKNMNFYIGSR